MRARWMPRECVGILVALLILGLAACGGHEVDFARSLAVKAPADLVLRGGKIVTVDRDFSIRAALAIKDGRFLAVGSDRDVRPLVGPATQVIDLAGRTVIPGLHDAHVYASVAGLTWRREIHWQSVRTLADGLSQIGSAAKTKRPGQWIVVGPGWVPTQFAERRFPTRSELDALSPKHPVYIQYLREGALVNSAALAQLGIDAESRNPAGGRIERDPQSGELTGWLQGKAAEYARAKIPPPDLGEIRSSLEDCFRELNRLGITAISDLHTPVITFAHRRVLADMARAGELPLRLKFYKVAESEEVSGQFKQTLAEIAGLQQNEWFAFAGFVMPDNAESFFQAAQLFATDGHNFVVRAGTDERARLLLDLLEQVHVRTPFERQRILFAELDDATPQTIDRIKRLRGGITVQSRMALTGERTAEEWGLEKARNTPPWRAMRESGIELAPGSGGFEVANYSPMVALWWIITGKTVGGAAIRDPRQNLSRAEALRLYTLGAAWSTFEEGRRGSIEVGKHADLAVLNADYLTVPEEQIRSLHSLLTIVGGRIVYAAAPFEAGRGKIDRRKN
jgi:predicted amidohydrolase YtcJ